MTHHFEGRVPHDIFSKGGGVFLPLHPLYQGVYDTIEGREPDDIGGKGAMLPEGPPSPLGGPPIIPPGGPPLKLPPFIEGSRSTL